MRLSYMLGAVACIGVVAASSSAFAAKLPSNIKTEHTKIGTVYANAKGMTVYEFKKDVPHSHKSACYGACAKLWPPVVTPTVFKPMKPWGIAKRKDGAKQITYEGYPLYTWIKDTKPGDITGQGVKGLWRVVMPGSQQVSWTKKP